MELVVEVIVTVTLERDSKQLKNALLAKLAASQDRETKLKRQQMEAKNEIAASKGEKAPDAKDNQDSPSDKRKAV